MSPEPRTDADARMGSPARPDENLHEGGHGSDSARAVMINRPRPDSHRLPLERAPEGYRNFHDNPNEWTRVVLKPY